MMCNKYEIAVVLTGKKKKMEVFKYCFDKKTRKVIEFKTKFYLDGGMWDIKRKYVKEIPDKSKFKNLLYYEKNCLAYKYINKEKKNKK